MTQPMWLHHKLQALAELCLYGNISLPFKPSNWYPRAQLKDDGPKRDSEGLRLLYRTITARPDLARMVKKIDFEVPWRWIYGHYGTSAGHEDPYQACEVSLTGGVLQRLENVNRVSLEIKGATTVMDPGENCLNIMFPGFEPLRAHLQWPVKFLQKVECLVWDGSLHWMMVGPSMTHVHLIEPCEILPDSLSHERQNKLEVLSIVSFNFA